MAAASLNVASCPKNPDAPELKVTAKVYATDHRTQSLVRKGSDGKIDRIKSSDPRFSGRLSITVNEYKKILTDVNNLTYQCRDWGPKDRGFTGDVMNDPFLESLLNGDE